MDNETLFIDNNLKQLLEDLNVKRAGDMVNQVLLRELKWRLEEAKLN